VLGVYTSMSWGSKRSTPLSAKLPLHLVATHPPACPPLATDSAALHGGGHLSDGGPDRTCGCAGKLPGGVWGAVRVRRVLPTVHLCDVSHQQGAYPRGTTTASRRASSESTKAFQKFFFRSLRVPGSRTVFLRDQKGSGVRHYSESKPSGCVCSTVAGKYHRLNPRFHRMSLWTCLPDITTTPPQASAANRGVCKDVRVGLHQRLTRGVRVHGRRENGRRTTRVYDGAFWRSSPR
jgi:hypothetical protein